MKYYKPYQAVSFLQSTRNWKKTGLLCCLFFFNFYTIQANDYFKEIYLNPINTYDEVPVEIIVKGYLRFEADVIITDTHAVYVNVEELFKKLGIYIVAENDGNILKGFIENESIRYVIDFDSKQISKNGSIVKSINGIVKELDAIYIETTILNEAFGLNMLFNFRSLSIKLEADFELPAVKEARLEKMRQNVSKLQSKNEVVIDTVLGRNYHLFNGGAMDWAVSSTQAKGEKVNNRFYLGLGSELLYGEATVAFNYYDQTKFDRRQLYYNWRWVDNDNNYIKQAELGKIGSQSIAFVGAPIVGASFNNSPNTVRKATGTYMITEFTEPNWTVELYINDNLVDYTEADASGLYEFEVPVVYGYTTLTLKFYGPLGEERIEQRTMNTPYTLMPAKVLEYNVSGGIVEDGDGSMFGRGEVNYGVNRFVTIGGGVEYLSSIAENPVIPFANISFQPFSKLMLNMEYAHNVSLSGLLNYNFGSSAFLEIDYRKFADGQQATLENTNEERKVRFTLPFKIKKTTITSKLSFNQYVYDAFNFSQLDALFSSRYKNYSANASLASNWVNGEDPFMTTTFMFSRRMQNGLILRPSLQYNITDGKMMRFRAEIEKRVARMSFSASYERNVQYATNNVFLNFSYDLPFARTGLTSSYSNNSLRFSENAQGSLAFGADNGAITTGNNAAIGRGGILCYPFLDINQNGKRDKNEQLVLLTNVRVTGGKAVISKKDSIVRISNLNAFINYNVTFSDDDLDNIAWRFKHKTYQILVDPNQYKRVDIPILVMGEISGMVYLNKGGNTNGQGRVTIQIIDAKGKKVAETLSESDGYYSYLGLKPGKYTIKIDESQLKKLGYHSTPAHQDITIKAMVDGDIVEGLDFEINNSPTVVENSKNPVKVEALKNKVNTTIDKEAVDGKTYYTIELGDFKNQLASQKLLNLNPIFYKKLPNGSVQYTYGKFTTKEEAFNIKNGLLLRNITTASVVVYKDEELYIPTTDSTLNSNDLSAPFVKIAEIEGAFYSVQIGVFKNKVSPKQLLNLIPLYYEVLPDSTTRYISGKYNTKNEARIAKNKIVVLGIKDAYIVAYKDGEKISTITLDKLHKNSRTVKDKISRELKKN